MVRGTAPVLRVVAAAALFGLSTPVSKALLGGVDPTVYAGLVYLASGAFLAVPLLLRRPRPAPLRGGERGRLVAVALAGGVAGPLLLVHGLPRLEGQAASLLLALEGGFTAALAALLFREHVGRAAWGAVGLSVAAAAVLAEPWKGGGGGEVAGALLVAGATLAWALDNNLSRGLAHRDPVLVACLKGLVAGPLSLGLGLALGHRVPGDPGTLAGAAAVGAVSYGLSLVLVLRGFADLGTSRTMALFATAPAFGAAASWVALGEVPGLAVGIAVPLLAAGVWLLSREHHEHMHEHVELEHEHLHVHDEHHRHAHRGDEGPEPHSHPHRHERLVHSHVHVPDLHHRHGHGA